MLAKSEEWPMRRKDDVDTELALSWKVERAINLRVARVNHYDDQFIG
jgi:hypothetical protein